MRKNQIGAALTLACLAVLAGVGRAATAAAAPLPSGLAGEILTAPDFTNQSCGAANTGNTFSVSGLATGPYPGTFTETGTTSDLPPNGPTTAGVVGPVTAFHADFTITSGSVTITGSKDLAGGPAWGFCAGGGLDFSTTSVTYQATISGPAGTFTDSGTATAEDATACNFNASGQPACITRFPDGSNLQPFAEDFVTSYGVIDTNPRPPDADLTLSTQASITANATGLTGATVTYALPTVTDEDSPLPTPTCSPASGAVFAVGTTQVTCMVSAPDDANSPVQTTFSVTVLGGADQLANLQQAVQGVGPGTILSQTVGVARSALAAGRTRLACATLTAFTLEVRALPTRTISASQQTQLVVGAQRIRSAIGC